MKWTYSLKNKLTAALMIFGLVIVVCFNNLFERNNAEKINATITTIFDDRFMVESFIFQYTSFIYQIKEILDHPGYSAFEKKLLIIEPMQGISLLNDAYKNTRFTKEETVYFNKFTDLCYRLSTNLNKGIEDKGSTFSKEAINILKTLSAIQISEAKLQFKNANQLYLFGNFFSKFEMAILVVNRTIVAGTSFCFQITGFYNYKKF